MAEGDAPIGLAKVRDLLPPAQVIASGTVSEDDCPGPFSIDLIIQLDSVYGCSSNSDLLWGSIGILLIIYECSSGGRVAAAVGYSDPVLSFAEGFPLHLLAGIVS